MRRLARIPDLLATSHDGVAAWRSFVRGVEAHVSGQQSLLPMIGLGIALLGLLALNVWIARRLVGGGNLRDSRR